MLLKQHLLAAVPTLSLDKIANFSDDEITALGEVEITGVVTHITPEGYSPLELVIDDGCGAIWISGLHEKKPQLGEEVSVRGRAKAGIFNPIFQAVAWKSLGQKGLPVAMEPRSEELNSGNLDGRWVAVSGVVRAVKGIVLGKDEWTHISLSFGRSRLSLLVPQPPDNQLINLKDHVIRAEGVCAHHFNQNGQLLNAQLRISNCAQITLIKSPPKILPLVKISDLLGSAVNVDFTHRVMVRGSVVAFSAGKWVHLMQSDRGLRVEMLNAPAFQLGDVVEAVGYAVSGIDAPKLEDAELERVGGGPPMLAKPSDAKSALRQEGQLIELTGRIQSWIPNESGLLAMIEHPEGAFAVTIPNIGHTPPANLGVGAEISVSGVCEVSAGRSESYGSYPLPESFSLLARDFSDFKLIRPAPWWTRVRLLIASLGLLLLCGLLLGVTYYQRKQSKKLADQVVNRTDQLTEQLSNNHQSLAELEAVSQDRTRLARELHDSVGQTLASAAWRVDLLQMETPETAAIRSQLAAIGNLLRSSQEELQRSVHNLRTPLLQRLPLSEAIRESVDALTHGTSVTAVVIVSGTPQPLDWVSENHILRFCQEAFSNTLRHASATRAEARLEWSSQNLTLKVHDNGLGFDLNKPHSSDRFHYGLTDLQERAAAMHGTLDISSNRDHGTTLTLKIPLLRHS